MSRKLLLLLCFVFVTLTAFSQTINSVVKKIAKHNVYESALIGIGASPSLQYKRFETLSTKASKQKLITLAARHRNAVVRIYAYKALLLQNEPIPEELKEKLSADKTSVKKLSGCIGGETTVSDIVSARF